MTHLWLAGEPIKVDVGENTSPIYFVWRGQTYPVEAILMRWRGDDEWWEARKWREYFKLTTRTGLLVVIYCDLIDLNWFLQRLYD